MTGSLMFLLFILAGVAATAAFVLIDKWLWRRDTQRQIDSNMQAFFEGRWR